MHTKIKPTGVYPHLLGKIHKLNNYLFLIRTIYKYSKKMHSLENRAELYISKNPYKCLATSFLIGLVLTRFFKK